MDVKLNEVQQILLVLVVKCKKITISYYFRLFLFNISTFIQIIPQNLVRFLQINPQILTIITL